MSIDAMKTALEALKDACGGRCNAEYNPCWQQEAAQALRLAIEQAEKQEPVAWMQEMPTKGDETRSVRMTTVEALAREEWPNPIPLYTTQPRREWVGLTEADMPDGEDPMYDDPRFIAGMVWAANKLQEKNG